MKKAIIIHGQPDKQEYYSSDNPDAQSNSHWIPWLQQQLNQQGILTQTPEMPHPYAPVYEEWLSIFEQFVVTEDTILIGHSCGGGFLVRWLSENDVQVDTVVLVAPWLNTKNEDETTMFNFEIDRKLAEKAKKFTVLYSKEDHRDITYTIEYMKEQLPQAQYVEFEGKGHFTLAHLGTRDFPEILEYIT